MAHRIDIRLGDFPDSERHKTRNFLDDVWLGFVDRGWAEWQDFDYRVKPGAVFSCTFPARDSHEAVTFVQHAITRHFMQTIATFEHVKRARADG
jgi:hypothetical protein